MSNKVFVLGLDGAVLDFINRAELPNFQKIIKDGSSGTLFSRPALTPVAWTSLATGKNPGKHGIFDFRIDDKLFFATDKKTKELWDFVSSIVINVPMTYPAKKINGIMISGMMSPSLDAEMVQPESERLYLKKLRYIIEAEQKIKSIKEAIKRRLELIKHYFDFGWQLFFVVFREFDVLHHFFWGQDLPVYKIIDKFLGKFLLSRLEKESIKLVIVSDHGFAPVDKAINIEKLLLRLGYQDYYQVGGWGALYKKKNEKWKDEDKRKEIIDRLKRYKVDGEQILNIYKNEKIYWGPYASLGPDLLVWPKRELGYTFAIDSNKVITNSFPKNGCHTEEGVIVLSGFDVKKKKLKADIKDVFPTIMKVLGEDIPPDIDGQVIG